MIKHGLCNKVQKKISEGPNDRFDHPSPTEFDLLKFSKNDSILLIFTDELRNFANKL